MRRVVEAVEEHLVVGSQQIEQEAIERRARRRDLRPRHAAARVEHDAEADRHPLGAEVRDLDRLIVLEYAEVALLEAGHEASRAVGHRGGDVDELDPRAEAELILSLEMERRPGERSANRQRERTPRRRIRDRMAVRYCRK